MKKLTLAASFLIAPVLVQAQAGVQAQTQATVDASASAKSSAKAGGSAATGASGQADQKLSADAQGKVDANLRVAREKKLPEEPIRSRVSEGQAKGASEAQIVAASGRTLIDLQSSFDAMVRGGHSAPSDEEIGRGAQLIARGYTSAQLEAVARKASQDRGLSTAFEALTSLQAQGTPTAQGVARVEALLAANASDAQLRALGGTGSAAAAVTGALNVGGGARNAQGAPGSAGSATAGVAGSAAAGAGAAAAGALGGVKGGATTGVAGAVGGVIGKP